MTLNRPESEPVDMATLEHTVEQIEKSLALHQKVLYGVCALGGWLIWLMTTQLGDFRTTLRDVSSTMQLVQIASEKVTTRVENISKQLDGLDARVEGNEREYYRDRAKQNGEGKHE